MEPMLEATGLTKTYGQTRALDDLDLTVAGGQVFALLGPNGAGKTTLVRTIATLARLEKGTLRVAGHDVRTEGAQVRRAIGLAGQFAAVEPALTGRENLQMVARLFGHTRRGARDASDRVLEQLGLTDAGSRPVRTYSGGMRRRLDLGASLVGAPRLLLLDEPTTGLDPRSRTELWAALEDLVAQGTDVVLTTQYLDEADRLADQIGIIDHGRLVAVGTANELKSRAGQDVLDVRLADSADLDRAAGLLGGEPTIDRADRRLTAPLTGGATEMLHRAGALTEAGIAIADVALRRPTLDDVFLSLTGRPTDDTDDTDDTGTLEESA
ncbi:ATP-binding cassette domain-containing protein [Nocardioides sp. AX2bis]|uniref:ATP-binding cassette domain-containing protein n=1 Tax=Nocardioides sp. AX2bis TaxID=2653157 RepID=UPI0012F23985|nr:ATP-binding cassette domain-containing protein [Nocardioides sp. AX2bis]VXC36025.1 Daunorubicin/doxorubicin resistance ATP-binding protein DrrA [Nocardioides sp. AX2bis]